MKDAWSVEVAFSRALKGPFIGFIREAASVFVINMAEEEKRWRSSFV
jgi:hypothetical protein